MNQDKMTMAIKRCLHFNGMVFIILYDFHDLLQDHIVGMKRTFQLSFEVTL